MKALSLLIVSLLFVSCAKYGITGKKKSKKKSDPVTQNEDLSNSQYNREVTQGDRVMWQSQDGRFRIEASPRQVFVGQPVYFRGECNGPIEWDFRDGNGITQPSPQHAFNRAGTFNVSAFCQDPSGPLRGSLTILVQSQVGSDHAQSPSQSGYSDYRSGYNYP